MSNGAVEIAFFHKFISFSHLLLYIRNHRQYFTVNKQAIFLYAW